MSDSEHLQHAAELARSTRFRVAPNPPVGCVLVRIGRLVAEGRHEAWGAPHAEVEGLRRAGARARGATAYVTLEPCGHTGKTPPCADALIGAGVREVVYAAADPNPETAGEGPRRLREAGVRVRRVRAPAALRRDLAPYLAHLGRRRPWVVAKWAMTLDGRVATRRRRSKWITSPEARRWAHRHLRATVDAVLVGAGTVRADDPALTNRARGGRRPLRVVVCGERPLPRRSQLLTDGGRTLLAVPEGFRVPRGAEAVVCGRDGRVAPGRLLRALHRAGVRRVLAEGGPGLLGALFDARLVDQVACFVAQRVVGGADAPGPVGGRGVADLAGALDLDDAEARMVGPDLLIEGYVAGRPPTRKTGP